MESVLKIKRDGASAVPVSRVSPTNYCCGGAAGVVAGAPALSPP
jgi:hypothetical protein